MSLLHYFLAVLIAFLSGIVALKIFIGLLKRAKFYYIAYYCWAVGFLTLLYSF